LKSVLFAFIVYFSSGILFGEGGDVVYCYYQP
jgi:hypothetical protein